MIQPPFLSTIGTTASHYISDHKNHGQKNQENDGQTGSHAWTGWCLRKGGGYMNHKTDFLDSVFPQFCFVILGLYRMGLPSEELLFITCCTLGCTGATLMNDSRGMALHLQKRKGANGQKQCYKQQK